MKCISQFSAQGIKVGSMCLSTGFCPSLANWGLTGTTFSILFSWPWSIAAGTPYHSFREAPSKDSALLYGSRSGTIRLHPGKSLWSAKVVAMAVTWSSSWWDLQNREESPRGVWYTRLLNGHLLLFGPLSISLLAYTTFMESPYFTCNPLRPRLEWTSSHIIMTLDLGTGTSILGARL